MTKQTALCILGMHRSGTSLITGICNLLGVEIGSDFLEANQDNEKGFWEHRAVIETHEDLLKHLGSGWDDTRILPENWQHGAEIKPYKEKLKEIIARDFTNCKLWGIKDPRMMRLIPLWLDVFAETKITPAFIIAWRSAASVALSLERRDGFYPEKSLLLWAVYNLEAERQTRGKTRVFVEYDKVIENWWAEFSRAAETLGISWPADAEEKINQLITPELKHHTQRELPETHSTKIRSWAEKTEHALKLLSHSESLEISARLDAIYNEIAAVDKDSREFSSLWYKEAARLRGKLNDSYTTVHERNLTIGELGTELHERNLAFIKANEDLTKTNEDVALLTRRTNDLVAAIEQLNSQLAAIFSSISWRITRPLRMAKRIWRESQFIFVPHSYIHAWRVYRHFGFSVVAAHLGQRLRRMKNHLVSGRKDYPRWISLYDTMTLERRQIILGRIAGLAQKPLISVVMPVYNAEESWLSAAIESVLNQLYPTIELCIADDYSTKPHVRKILERYAAKDSRVKLVFRATNGHISEASNSALALATGEFIALMDHDDVLPEHALYYIAEEINAHPDADLIYSDEDKIDSEGRRFDPYFKGDFDIDALFARNIFSHLGVYRRALVEKVGGFRKGFEGSQDYDLLLRCLLLTDRRKIWHIPRILYHWRAISGSTAATETNKDYALKNAKKALAEYFSVTGTQAKIENGMLLGFNRIVWPLAAEPKAAIIIPTRNGVELLRKCIESIKEKTVYGNYEIIVVDNQSDDPETRKYFAELEREIMAKIIPYDAPFNYSAINNMAAKKTDAEILVFMNNDIEIISPGWLREMAAHAVRPDVGAVGAKLYYPNETIQHGGVMLGFGSPKDPVAGHLFHTLPRNHPGYFGRAVMAQALSGVTAALMVMRKSVFEEIGGFDEKNLPVAFNDVDICLRIAKHSYRIVWTPYAEAYHHESATRGNDLEKDKIARFRGEIGYMRGKWGKQLDCDPYYNPNLDLEHGNFTLAFPPRI